MMWLIFALVLLLTVLFVRYMWPTQDVFQKMNADQIPSSWIIGNFIQVLRKGLFVKQIHLYNQFRNKKAYGIYISRKPVLVVQDLDLIKDIMVKSFNNFVNRQTVFAINNPFKENLLIMKGEQWKNVRKTVNPVFSSSRIKMMSQHVERISNQLVDVLKVKHEKDGNIELKSVISTFTLDLIAKLGFGLDVNTMENPENTFAGHVRKFYQPTLFWLAFVTPEPLKLIIEAGYSIFASDAMAYFSKTIDSLIENRKKQEQAGKLNDFIDILINSEHASSQSEKRSLTRSELHGQAMLLVFAAYDTLSTVVSSTLFLLANHPECCQIVQKEIDEKIGNELPNYDNVQGLNYLDMCIDETMRLFPPGFTLNRVCTDDVTLQGIHIPKGMNISFPVYAIHHDPEFWPEPEKFRPERFSPENKDSRHPYAFLPFGHGPRNCMGIRLSYLVHKVALAYVLKALTPVQCEKTVHPVKLDKFIMKSVDGLWVKFEARN